jgi:hypothetical protein
MAYTSKISLIEYSLSLKPVTKAVLIAIACGCAGCATGPTYDTLGQKEGVSLQSLQSSNGLHYRFVNESGEYRCAKAQLNGGASDSDVKFSSAIKEWHVIKPGENLDAGYAYSFSNGSSFQASLLWEVKEATKTEDDGYDCSCFITTAVCHHAGKSDDCTELMTLRWFRDNVMLQHPEWAEEVEEYYRIAPAIVKAINQQEEAGQIYSSIQINDLDPAVTAVIAGNYDEAHRLYKDMTLRLKDRYL